MISVFRYPGGKTKRTIQSIILHYAPIEINEYREPFVGGGGIFFALDGETPYNGIARELPTTRWINDINPGLIAVYEALRDRPVEFIAQCKAIQSMQAGEPQAYPTEGSSGKKYNARLLEEFRKAVACRHTDPAFSYFFINRTVWGGRVNYDVPSRLYFSNPQGWNIVDTDRLEQAARHVSGVKITATDFELLLEEDGENVWIYCDPPYVKDTNLQGPSKLYQEGFADMDDHVRFRDAVLRCKHKVCISYDDDEDGYVRSLYSDSKFRIYAKTWKYSGTSSAKSLSDSKSETVGKSKSDGKELIITNYAPKRLRSRKIFT